MLVLSRMVDESLMIDDDIEIMIVAVNGGKVRLGITAPKERVIHRTEVYEAIQKKAVARVERIGSSGIPELQAVSGDNRPEEQAGTSGAA